MVKYLKALTLVLVAVVLMAASCNGNETKDGKKSTGSPQVGDRAKNSNGEVFVYDGNLWHWCSSKPPRGDSTKLSEVACVNADVQAIGH